MTATAIPDKNKTDYYARKIRQTLDEISARISYVREDASKLFEESGEREDVKRAVKYLTAENGGDLESVEQALDLAYESLSSIEDVLE